jgi:hypothetical protein
MFKHSVTDLDTQPMMTQQRLMCAVHVSTLSHTSCCTLKELFGRTQNLTSVCTVVKSTSCNASPGLNSLTFTWHMVQHMATAGKHIRFIMSILRTEHVQIIVCSLLSTIACVKLVHLHWTSKAEGRNDQFACRNLMNFTAFWEKSIHKQPCGSSHSKCKSSSFVKHVSRRSFLCIGRRCRLYSAPVITFVETN